MWKIDKGSRTGTTANSYSDALTWLVAELGNKTILLKNTHGSNSLHYRLYGYAVEEGIDNEMVPETELSAGEVAEFHYDRQWSKLVLQVKAAIAENQATFRIDYEGQGA
jgi:hypothetical protein